MSSNLAHEVIFSRKSSIVSHLHLTFINIPVAQVNSLKHLGTQLDKKLNFKEHLSNIESKEIKLFVLFANSKIFYHDWHLLQVISHLIGLTQTEAELFPCCSLLVTFCFSLITFCSLLVSFCLLLVTFCSSLVTFSLLLISFCSLLATFCLLLVTVSSLLVTFCSLLVTFCSLLFARYFCVWCKSRELRNKTSPRFHSGTPVVEGFSSDLLQAVISYWADSRLKSCQTSTLKISCKNNYIFDLFTEKNFTACVRLDSE